MIVNVPLEYKGLARLFRQRVETAERNYDDALVAKVIEPLRQRLARKPTLRREAVADITRTLAELNNEWRISSVVEILKRGHLRITEHVIGAAHNKEDHWDEWDRSIGIIRVVVTTEGGVKVATDPIATVSGHAIARYYERTTSRDDAKLLADIGTILDAKHEEVVIAKWRGLAWQIYQRPSWRATFDDPLNPYLPRFR